MRGPDGRFVKCGSPYVLVIHAMGGKRELQAMAKRIERENRERVDVMQTSVEPLPWKWLINGKKDRMEYQPKIGIILSVDEEVKETFRPVKWPEGMGSFFETFDTKTMPDRRMSGKTRLSKKEMERRCIKTIRPKVG